MPFDNLKKPSIPSKRNHCVSLSQTDAYWSAQGHFKLILINIAMLELAYNQTKNIYTALQGTAHATSLPSNIERTSENI